MIYTDDIMGYQWALFLKSIPVGALLAFCYDVLRFVRITVHFGKKLYIASDLLYCLWAGFLVFSFLLNENFGMIRFYIVLAMALGFSAWEITVGRLVTKISLFLRKIFSPVFRKIKLIFEKAKGKTEKILKKPVTIVYNILCLNISKAFSFWKGKVGKEHRNLESSTAEKTEEGTFTQDCSYRLHGVPSLFADFDTGEYKR